MTGQPGRYDQRSPQRGSRSTGPPGRRPRRGLRVGPAGGRAARDGRGGGRPLDDRDAPRLAAARRLLAPAAGPWRALPRDTRASSRRVDVDRLAVGSQLSDPRAVPPPAPAGAATARSDRHYRKCFCDDGPVSAVRPLSLVQRDAARAPRRPARARSPSSRARSATPAASSARSTSSASSSGKKVRDVTVDAAERRPHRRGSSPPSARSRASRSSTSPTARSCSTSAARSRWRRRSPLKTRDDLSMAYTPGVARVCTRDRRRPEQGLEPDDQAEHGRGRHRRHRRARARRHRPRGRDAGDGGQGDALQGVRRRRRLADLPRDEGRRRDRRGRRGDRPGLRRHQPRGHLGAALLRDRERACEATLDIPVFHDDQHGTAIVVLAALHERAARRRQARSRT